LTRIILILYNQQSQSESAKNKKGKKDNNKTT